MKNISLFIIGLLLTTSLLAQIAPDKYYVQFTDKDNSPYSIQNPEAYLSQRAIDRRAAYNIPIDIKDLPVNPQYLQAVKDAGATILNPTKWLNGVSIHTSDSLVIAAIESLPFVQGIVKSPLNPGGSSVEKPFFRQEKYSRVAPNVNIGTKASLNFDYGPSYNQINMLKGDQMHELGYTGEGVIIAVLDAGYDNANTLPVFDSLWNNGQILATHDFVDGGEITFNKHSHGTKVLSTMGGHYPGEIVGTAPYASYVLIRSEDGGSEYIIEEYNWVSAAEFADSLGADVINSSLGYSYFDDSSQDHTYADMDGNTTPVTIGADMAASRGMAVVTSAGNSGSSAWYYITAPADGDSVYSIGAVNWEGNFWIHSGHGPTYDGRVKPNVVAQGEGAYFANTSGGFTYGNGTSFSSPILAGMVACLWQANPGMNNMDLLNAIQASGTRANDPDDNVGYGIPDFMAAHNILTIIDGDEEAFFDNVNIYPNPFTSYCEVTFSTESRSFGRFTMVDLTGRTVYENEYALEQGINRLQVNEIGNIPSGVYFMRLESGNALVTMKIVKQ
jgi:hypothetical protein